MLALRYVYPITKLSTYELLYLPMYTFIQSSSNRYLESSKSDKILILRLSTFYLGRGRDRFLS